MLLAFPTQVDDGRPPGLSTTRPPVANSLLIAANVLLFFLGVCLPVSRSSGPLSLVGYAFSHAGLPHLMVNMWLLWVVGNPVNRRVGDAFYLAGYSATVLGLGVSAKFLSSTGLVGSSGAIYAVIAALAMLLPAARTTIGYVALFPLTLLIGLLRKPTHWLFWLIRWDAIHLRAFWFLLLVPLMQVAGLAWWGINWANVGHLGGFVIGVALVLTLPTRVSMHRHHGMAA